MFCVITVLIYCRRSLQTLGKRTDGCKIMMYFC